MRTASTGFAVVEPLSGCALTLRTSSDGELRQELQVISTWPQSQRET
jgi:hypothetical protein